MPSSRWLRFVFNLTIRTICIASLLLCGILLGLWLFSGEDSKQPSQREASDGKIPCIVHQTWRSSQLPSTRAQRWRDSWTHCLPECRHILWTDEDNRRHIGMHFPWLLPTYECLKSGIQKSDLAKYSYLLHYGGIYADLDTVCLRDFRPLLQSSSLTFASMEGSWGRSVKGKYVQNSLMASTPKHTFWLGLLKRIVGKNKDCNTTGPTPPEGTTGSFILMEHLQQYIEDGNTDASIFPAKYFNPFSWITGSKANQKAKDCKTMGSMNDETEASCLAAFPDSYVVHMHSKSWGGGRI